MSGIALGEKAGPGIAASDIVETIPSALIILDRDLNIASSSGKEELGRGSTSSPEDIGDVNVRKLAEEALLKAGALQKAIFNSANFSSIATDAKGVIQIFNVGAERMLGYTAAEVMNKITPADISDPQELIARA